MTQFQVNKTKKIPIHKAILKGIVMGKTELQNRQLIEINNQISLVMRKAALNFMVSIIYR